MPIARQSIVSRIPMKLALQLVNKCESTVVYKDRVAVEIKPHDVSWIRLG
jgi:hypothetical protein